MKMAKCLIDFTIIFIALMAHPLKAVPPSSEEYPSFRTYFREFIRHPVLTFQSMYIRELDFILGFKRTYDWYELTGTDALFANLAYAADAIKRQALKKDAEVISIIGSGLEKNETTECKEMFLMWKRIAIKLWDSYHKCRADGMANATMYEGQLRKSEHVFRDIARYRNMLQGCIDMDEFFLSYGPIICTLRVQVSLLLFLFPADTDIRTYIQASNYLIKLKRELGTHERCVDTREVYEFHERAKTILMETKNCVDRNSVIAHDV